MGKIKKTKAPVAKKKPIKKVIPPAKKSVKKIVEPKASKESPRKKALSSFKGQKTLTAEGWKRLMMGAKK